MDPLKMVVDTIFQMVEQKFARNPLLANFLQLANTFVDADLLPLIEEKLKDKGISITI